MDTTQSKRRAGPEAQRARRFAALFGSDATEADFDLHLKGRKKILITPADAQGRCSFGVIVPKPNGSAFDHIKMAQVVKALGLSLLVIKSKNGAGMFLYFCRAQPTADVRSILTDYATLLGCEGAVIYPTEDNKSFPAPYFKNVDNVEIPAEGGIANCEQFIKHAEHLRLSVNTEAPTEEVINEAKRQAPPSDGELKVSLMSAIVAKPLRPLLDGFLYLGKVTIVAGLPGDGKSLTALDIAARITKGKAWPVGKGAFTTAPVILLTAEDDPADTIRPRLDVADANNDLVALVEGTYHVDEKGERSLDIVSLINDLPAIERLIVERGAHVLIIDPLTSFADSDTNKTADMRRLLDAIAQMAIRTDIAVLVNTHLNKRSDASKAMQLIAGSHILVAAVRVVLVSARDPNDKTRRLILPIKVNIGPEDLGFAFRVVVKQHTVCGDVAAVQWESAHVKDMRADDVLIDSAPRAQAAIEKTTEVQGWLRELLKDGPVAARDMWVEAEKKGFNEHRVRGALKVIKARGGNEGYQGRWHYWLPSVPGEELNDEEAAQ